MQFSSRELMAALSTSMMRPCRSFSYGQASVWKRKCLKSFELHQSASEREQLGERRPAGHQSKFQTFQMLRNTLHGSGPCSRDSAIGLFLRVPLLTITTHL